MTDRELFKMALNELERLCRTFSYPPDILYDTINALRARLAQPEPWVKTYSGGKPNYTQPEQVAQFKFQEYGPPNWGDFQVTKSEFVAEQKAMHEALRKGVMDGIPDMLIKVQDEREENYKSFAQSAQVLGITEPEPVAWKDKYGAVIPHSHKLFKPELFVDYTIPLYTVPLQQPEQEPVAWITGGGKGELWWHQSEKFDTEGNLIGKNPDDIPLYTAPPKKEWVDLTEEEIEDLTSVMFEEPSNEEVIDFASRVQAKLKEKNSD